MDELLPGVFHWTAFHDGIGKMVHSYYLALPGGTALVDPMPPDAEFERAPERIILTNRHHYRDSDNLRERFDCPVLCHEAGLHEFERGPEVEGFAWGNDLMPGVRALEVGVICDEETALSIDAGHGALAFADAVIRKDDGSLGFVPDSLLGDDAEDVKRGLRASFKRLLLGERFDSVLTAHGGPVMGRGRDALRQVAEGG